MLQSHTAQQWAHMPDGCARTTMFSSCRLCHSSIQSAKWFPRMILHTCWAQNSMQMLQIKWYQRVAALRTHISPHQGASCPTDAWSERLLILRDCCAWGCAHHVPSMTQHAFTNLVSTGNAGRTFIIQASYSSHQHMIHTSDVLISRKPPQPPVCTQGPLPGTAPALSARLAPLHPKQACGRKRAPVRHAPAEGTGHASQSPTQAGRPC